MTKKNEKMPKWPKFLINLDNNLRSIWHRLEREIKRMFDWLLFYKPKDKQDKKLHYCEVIIAYILIQFAWKGLFGL